jgi:hypothetical protein
MRASERARTAFFTRYSAPAAARELREMQIQRKLSLREGKLKKSTSRDKRLIFFHPALSLSVVVSERANINFPTNYSNEVFAWCNMEWIIKEAYSKSKSYINMFLLLKR